MMNLHDLYQRVGVIAGSVVTLVTALAVAVSTFVNQVTPALPDGWQDNAASIGGTVVAVLGAAALAIRRVTEVPAGERGILPVEPAPSDIDPDDTPFVVGG